VTDLTDLLDNIELEEWLDHHAIDYRRSSGGNNLQLHTCPVCHDDRWRIYLHAEKKVGQCLHAECRAKFNLFTFARAHLGADNRGTIRHFEEYASRVLRLPRKPRAAPKPAVLAEGGLALPESVALPTPEGMTHPYLLDRSVLPATQSLFGLRWCEDGAWSYEDVQGTARKMWFGGRILMPICDLDGAVRTFVGRDATGSANVRYLFPPRLPSAARYLYGAELAGHAEHLILGEGPFDAIAIHQALAHPDFRACAALGSFGLSLGHGDPQGDDQLGRLIQLRRGAARRVTMLWDGEANALKHALDAADLLCRHGLPTSIGLLPTGKDPGEVDTATIRRAISEAQAYSATLRLRYTLQISRA
jgi:DNA primase